MTVPDVKTEVIKVSIVPADLDGKAIGRILLSLAVTGGTIALMVYLERTLSGPDMFLTIKMRALRLVSDTADKASKSLAKVSANADTMYLASRI
jgi:hypothetical protein